VHFACIFIKYIVLICLYICRTADHPLSSLLHREQTTACADLREAHRSLSTPSANNNHSKSIDIGPSEPRCPEENPDTAQSPTHVPPPFSHGQALQLANPPKFDRALSDQVHLFLELVLAKLEKFEAMFGVVFPELVVKGELLEKVKRALKVSFYTPAIAHELRDFYRSVCICVKACVCVYMCVHVHMRA